MGKKQGFTLIEIIIVVVILGILAAVALPKLTQNVGKAAAAEAFNVGGEFAKAFDRCLAEQSAGVAITNAMMLNCNTFAKVNMATPPITNFTYALQGGGTATDITLTAAGKLNGLAVTDIVTFVYDGAAGTNTKTCGGLLVNMCK